MIDDELLGILACPACRGDVRQEGREIICNQCGRRYPVRDSIPVMLIEESRGGDETGPDESERS